jgi:hypothetical protein
MIEKSGAEIYQLSELLRGQIDNSCGRAGLDCRTKGEWGGRKKPIQVTLPIFLEATAGSPTDITGGPAN